MQKVNINCDNHRTAKAIHNLLWFFWSRSPGRERETERGRETAEHQAIQTRDYKNKRRIISKQSNIPHKCQPLQLDVFMRAFSPPPRWKQVLPRPSAQRLQCAPATQQLCHHQHPQGRKATLTRLGRQSCNSEGKKGNSVSLRLSTWCSFWKCP